MKKLILTLVVTLSCYCSYAQTNTFPSSGNVGIGTTSPITTLDVDGQLFSRPLNNNAFVINNSGSDYGFISTNATDTWSLGHGPTITSLGTPVVTWKKNGYVGIGTTDPAALLQIGPASNSTIHYQAIFGAYDSATGYPQLVLNNPGTNYVAIGNSITGDLVLGTTANVNSAWLSQQLVIEQSTGNVGIGTTTPDALLSVAGTIHTKEVKVDLTGWPDYVFRPTYKLTPLKEVKAYINQNQHLPEMPSEQEVKDSGINLGEMNKLLTKKVEELTLYAIEQQKQIEQQQANHKHDEARIAKLEAALSKLTANK